MLEHLSEKFVSLAEEIMQVSKELKKTNKRIQTNLIRGKMSQKKSKNGDDKKVVAIAIKYIDDNGSKKTYQPKGYLSYRPKEKRWMGRFRKIDRKEKCVYARTKRECKELLDLEIEKYCRDLNLLIKQAGNQKSALIASAEKGISKTMTLNTWFYHWLNTFKKNELKMSTYRQYVEIWERYTKKTLGEIKINIIDSTMIQEHINSISAISGQQRTYRIFNFLFSLLFEQKYISVNHMSMIVLPRHNKKNDISNKKGKILLYKDEKKLFDFLSKEKKKNKYYYPIKVALYTGLRRGELLGLQWKHIDFENKTITVEQQYDIDIRDLTTVKTDAANRIIPILPEAEIALKELFDNLNPTSLEDFVFVNPKMNCIGITQRLGYYSNMLGFKINPHLLRHTFTSRSYYAGLDPKRIQALLGHEQVDTTLNTYTHVLEAEDKEIIQKMRNFYIEKEYIFTLQ